MDDALGHDAFICAQDGRRKMADTLHASKIHLGPLSEHPSIFLSSFFTASRLSPIAFLSTTGAQQLWTNPPLPPAFLFSRLLVLLGTCACGTAVHMPFVSCLSSLIHLSSLTHTE